MKAKKVILGGISRLLNRLVLIPVSIIALAGDMAAMRLKRNDDELAWVRLARRRTHNRYPAGNAVRAVVPPGGVVQIRRNLTIGDVVRKAASPAPGATYTIHTIDSHFNGDHYDETYTLTSNYDGKQICDRLFQRSELVLVRRARQS